MRIIVGTKNVGKIEAVRRGIKEYSLLSGSIIESCDVDSGVPAQPIGLEMIVSGAKNRALSAYKTGEYDMAFGIESGIFEVPHTKSGYLDTSCCVIYDGSRFHIGFSSCFEYPTKMIEKVLWEHKEICDIALELGFAEHREFREWLGMVGTLTKGRITRIDYTYQAVQMALIHLENPEYY